jgi:photosystem II stability/assembly factor-like uncharacterized protein
MKKLTNATIKAHLLRSALFLLLLLAVCAIPFLFGQGTSKQSFQEDVAAREAWERLRLQDEHGRIPPGALQRAYQQKKSMRFLPEAWAELLPKRQGIGPEEAEQLMWTSIGPGNIGGRIRSIVIHPTADLMWLGAVGGGVWETTNGGNSWFETMTDLAQNLAVNCMAVDPTNPNVFYAGTGEGFFSVDVIRGDGIFKTTNGGSSWAQLSSTACTATNGNFCWVNRLAISPTEPQVLLAATRNGIFRTTDGGANWSQRLAGVFDDVLFQANNGSRCIASTHYAPGKAYYSMDAGLNWTQATVAWPTSAGRIELAYSRSDPSIVYAGVENNGGELYRSTDSGHTFPGPARATGTGASWYNNVIWVDPTNSDTLLFGGGNLYRSTNGGTAWVQIPSGHADNHVVVNDRNYNGNTNRTVYVGNDGGIYKIPDILAPNAVSLNHTLSITQFYGGAGNASSGTTIGGTQDNGTVRYLGNPEGWTTMYGGDGGFCAADQTDPNYFYGEYINLQIVRSTNGGASASPIWNGPNGIPPDCNGHPCANFIAPFVLDPSNPNTLLGGGTNLWRSTNAKAPQPSWASIKPPAADNISAIAVAPDNSDIIWVGYNNGAIYYTTNGTATNPAWTQVNAGLPARYCDRITIAPQPPGQDSRTIYVSFGGFFANNIWKTQNNGATWASISTGLPSIPIFSLVISPLNSTQLYIGTQIGVFASANGGNTWSPSSEGPANTTIDELFWVASNLVAATHGRSMFSATIQQ